MVAAVTTFFTRYRYRVNLSFFVAAVLRIASHEKRALSLCWSLVWSQPRKDVDEDKNKLRDKALRE